MGYQMKALASRNTVVYFNRMAAGSRLQVQVMDFFFFSSMLFAVKLRVLGLMAYWYAGSAFHNHIYSYA